METIEELNKALLTSSKGADINAKGKNGYTPLHRASIDGQTKTALALISKGSDVNAKDNHCMTAIHFACKYEQTETALTLISKGADVNAKDNGGQTPLHFACDYDCTETALALISKGVDIHAEDNNGYTSLRLACANSYTETALALISHGAGTSLIHKNLSELRGLTMHQAAAQSGFTERMIELLNDYPSVQPQNAPDALAALAKEHDQHDTAAAIQSFIAARAIEKMMKQAQASEIISVSQAQTQPKKSSAKRIFFKRKAPN